MNPLAEELNGILDGTAAGRLLSEMGRRLYFPRGIIVQAAEAKRTAHTANATIGMAYREGKPLMLSAIAEAMPGLGPEEAVAYAPTAGVEKLRRVWKDLMAQKNPSLDAGGISLPVVVPGLTGGISFLADMFLDEGDRIISCDPCWDNYSLIFRERRNAEMVEVPFFGAGPGLDLGAFAGALRKAAAGGSAAMILNFPNNPAGYSPTKAEAEALVSLIAGTAQAGADLLVICDDAYFGHFFEEDLDRESLFSRLAALHERVLAVKVDGPIKEDYVWGLRVAFVTFGCRGLGPAQYEALNTKLMGAIRSSLSCAATPSQYIVLKALEDPRSAGEKEAYLELLRLRYLAVKRFIRENPPCPALAPMPFNSGYFMSFRCQGVSAELLRRELLSRHGIGVVALGEDCLRIAFSSVDEEKIPLLYRAVYDTASALAAP